MFRPCNLLKPGQFFVGNSKGLSEIHDSVHEGTKKNLTEKGPWEKVMHFFHFSFFLLNP